MSSPDTDEIDPLVFGYGFGADGTATPLEWKDVRENGHPDFQLVWLHLNRQSQKTQDWLIGKSGLDWLTADALLQEETRPRAVRHGKGFLINLRGVNLNEGADPEDLVSLRMWASEDLLITMRGRRVQAARDVEQLVKAKEVPYSTGALVALLADALTDRMEPLITGFDDEADRYEDELLDPKVRLSRSVLPEFRRRVLRVRRYLIPQREAIATLVRDGVQSGIFSEQDAYFLRESADRVTRLSEVIENIRERSTVLQEELIQEGSEETNQRLFVLAILSAVFLPLSFVTGLFGVNLGGIPGAADGQAFPLLVGALAVSTVLVLSILRWRRWI
ncbi:MAG: CorA family divalent cation transporter [Hyphomonas sp.]|uniref:CorA family divalent cation transporter n=1 Tax=Hyphomonas sp. TaxID=87 RepID=UPI0035276BEE